MRRAGLLGEVCGCRLLETGRVKCKVKWGALAEILMGAQAAPDREMRENDHHMPTVMRSKREGTQTIVYMPPVFRGRVV